MHVCLGFGCCFSRRRFLGFVAVGATAGAVSACAGDNGLTRALAPTDQELNMLGQQTWTDLRQKEKLSTDTAGTQQVDRVARKVVDASGLGSAYNWEFALFDSPEVNAFALPGGRIGVYRGLLQIAQDDAQLAAVLGHEVTHVANHHAAQRIGAERAGSLGAQIAQVGLGASGVTVTPEVAGILGAGVSYGIVLPFSRDQEYEADSGGLVTMAKAGYDPNAAVTLWQRMAVENAKQPGQPLEFMSTHPSEANRIGRLQQQIPSVMPVYEAAKPA
ncbi:M48 family peptidase [Oleomonas cavernae]|uniref:M48 family peptidase n=1 Tax=Oleomonas cavernae TaxID=2320859 RepID=A0A418WBF5_9PROT|nr:M48 family metallopeptidase [Oleomonas cavernae]RJF87352.1 M48 family peptidase [Oleomonas cavernae]